MKEEYKKQFLETAYKKQFLETAKVITHFVCFLAILETIENYNEIQKIGVQKFIEKTEKKCLEEIKKELE